jgi:hypothetical protein
MMTSVPQFIDVEDKVAGPLTWKQLGWMIAMGAAIFLLYTVLSGIFFFVLAVPVAIFFIALAFFRPNGMSFPHFLMYSTLFLFRPKVSVWERPVHRTFSKQATPQQSTAKSVSRQVSSKDFAALAKQVDKR